MNTCVVVACAKVDVDLGLALVSDLESAGHSARTRTLDELDGSALDAETFAPCDVLVLLVHKEAPEILTAVASLAKQSAIPLLLACSTDASIPAEVLRYAKTFDRGEGILQDADDRATSVEDVQSVVKRFLLRNLGSGTDGPASPSIRPTGDGHMRANRRHSLGRNDLFSDLAWEHQVEVVGPAEALRRLQAQLENHRRADQQSSPDKPDPTSEPKQRRFRRKASEGSTTELPSQDLDAVHFGVTTPEWLTAHDVAIVDIWAFLASQRQQVLQAAREEHREPVTTVTHGPVPVPRGTALQARLQFEDLVVAEPTATIMWTGEVGKATFAIKVPAGLEPGPRLGRVSILLSGLPVAHLTCIVRIASQPLSPTRARWRKHTFDTVHYRQAFASYASRDRRAVLARIQGLEKAGVDVFMDVKSLRSGERYEDRLCEEIMARDVFYLFWSKAARASRWVDKEWRFALARRGMDFIDPIPLVTPDRAPPPKELALHFNDWTLAYATSQAFAPTRWWRFWQRRAEATG